jgi:uncharacterized protein YjbJ (UPF0337 family)
MDWNHLERMWKQIKGKVQEKWSKLTDDDLEAINGRRDRLEVKIQQRYGFAPDHTRKELDDWIRWQVPVSSQRRSRSSKSQMALARGIVDLRARADGGGDGWFPRKPMTPRSLAR